MHNDSVMNELNNQLNDRLKLIRVTGMQGIADDDISIYNDIGIKAMSRFNDKIKYSCELAVPLKYLGLNNQGKFSYNIKLNGIIPKGSTVVDNGRPDLILFVGSDGANYMVGKATPENMTLSYPTNFLGEYTLAK